MSKKAAKTAKNHASTGANSASRAGAVVDEQTISDSAEELARQGAVMAKSGQAGEHQGDAALSDEVAASAQADVYDETSENLDQFARDVVEVPAAESVLAAIQDGDHGGESLLMTAADTVSGKKEEDDDRAAAPFRWSDTLPWLAALGGLAALASIKTDSSDPAAPAAASGASGVVFDTPVTNAIVFRDANGDGKWNSGEAITVTDSQGRFSSLGGSGNIVATSLDRLVARINDADVTYTADDYAAFNAVSGLHLTSGYAIDVGNDLNVGTADDFVWSGTYSSTTAQSQGAVGVYVTAVSSLVTAYLAAQGVSAPTQAQIDAAVTQLKAVFAYDDSTGISGQGANVQFLTSDLNGQVTKIMGEAIAKAQAAGTDVQQAIADALDTLAQAAAGAYESEGTLDLTSAADLQSVFDITTAEAEALALQTESAGPAVYSIWYTEDGNAQATQIDSVDTIQNDGPIGNITVLTQSEGSSADLTVEPTDGADALSLQHAHVLVQSAGDGSAANLTLSSATGTLTEVIVRADGNMGTPASVASWRTNIEDGGADQYDNGNYLSSDTHSEIPYSDTVANGNFGAGSQNVAVYQDSIFGMLVKGNTSDSFSITGNTGQDVPFPVGDALEDVLTFTEYNGYQAIAIRSYGEEPSMNRVFIYKADANVTIDEIDGTADTEDYFIHGLSEVDQFGYFVLMGSSDVEAIASADLEAFFHAAVDDVLLAGTGSAADMKAAFYDTDTQTALRGSMALYADFTNYEYSVDGAFTLSSSDVSVDTNSTANGNIDFSGDVQSNLSVVATGESADASLNLHSTSGEINMQGGDISVTASGSNSDASATISNISGNTGAVNVLASAILASASANISGDLAIDGNVSVSASAESADAHLTLTDASSTDTFSGGDISVTASGASSDAGATMINVSGSVGAVSVTTSGYSGDAHLNLDVKEDAQLEAASLTVTASDESATAGADISGDVGIAGSITLTASGSGSTASADINTSGSGSTFLGSGDGGGDITILASGDNAEAGADIRLASGTVGDMSISASGDGSQTDASLTLQTEGDGVTAASLTLHASGTDAQASADISGDVGITGNISLTASGSGSMASADINTSGSGSTFLGSGDVGADLTILASGDNAEAGAEIRNASGIVNDISVTASGNGSGTNASLNLQTEGDGVTAASLTVTATGTDAAASADISGDVAITGDISVTATASGSCADVEINTSGSGSTVLGVAATSEDAAMGSNVTVSADVATATAALNIGNASGNIESLAVTANDGTASLDIAVADESTLTISTVDVTSNGTGHASADVHGSADSTVAITGNVTVSANGALDPATLYVNGTDVNGSTVLGTSADTATNDISVTATTGATAYAYLNNASGQADELTVTAENGNADAGLDVGVASGESLSVASLSVTASGSNDSADAYLWNHGASSELAITGSITVEASGNGSTAYGEVNRVDWERDSEGNWTSGDAVGHVVLGVAGEAEVVNISYDVANTVVGGHLITTITTTSDVLPGTAAVGADLTVDASGASADAGADMRNASGTVAIISVTASSTDASAGLYLQTENYNGVDGVTAASLTVEASGSADTAVSADTGASAHAEISGDVTITGAIGVTASGACADATADINTSGSGHTVLGVAAVPELSIQTTVLRDGQVVDSVTETVREGAAAIGSDLTVLASADSADASADIRNASGAVAHIGVTASATDASAYLYLQTESHNSVDGVTAASLTVEASAQGAGASADISGDVGITGDINVTANGASSDATLNINDGYAGNTLLGGGNLTVTASAQSADATVDIRNASGSLGDILVQATDTPDADALLNLEVAFGETLEIGSLTLSSDQLPTDASSDVSVDIRGNVLITGDISVTGGDEASLDINTWGSAETALGGGDITIEADHADADATVAIYNASGIVGDISVTATNWDNDGEQYAEASFDLRIAEDQQLEINNITVEANGSADARMDLNGNVSIDGNISIHANGSRDVLSATLGLNNAAADASVQAGETRLNGGNISVDVDGSGDAIGWIHNASGSLGDVTVQAFGETGNAALDLAALQPGQHQVQKITLNEAALSGLGEGDDVQINIDGYWFSHTMGQCAYLSNAEKLAEIVQAFRDSGDYAGLGADVYQEGNSLVIRWNDYQNHAWPRALEINGNETGFSTSENAAAPSLSFDSSDLTVRAGGAYSEAHLSVDGATGTLHDVQVLAVMEANTANANVGFSGNLSGDIQVEAWGNGNNAALDLHADPSGRIQVDSYWASTDMHVGAYGLDSHATASLSGLDGRIDQLEIVSDVKGAEASANLQFASGSLNYACMDAVDHQSTVRLTVDQTERNGTVDVAGQGHAAVTYYVDGNNATAGEIDLSGMHGNPWSNDTDSSSHDWWGYADIDLVAKYNDVLHQPGTGMQTSCNDTLWDNRMAVQDFNALRDSINVVLQDDADGDEGTQNNLVRHEIAYMHSGDITVNAGVDFDNAIDDLLYDARNWFDNLYSGSADQGFYQREITVNYDGGGWNHFTYMVYDYQLGNASSLSGDASGLIEMSNTWNVSWRNVADRYDIVSQAQSNDTFGAWNNYVSHDLVGVHAIDNLTVGAYDDGANYQQYLVSHDADVMVSDITVEALNPGYHGWNDDTRAGLSIWSKTSDGCGDSYFELRQSDVNVIAHGQWYGDAYANAELSLSDAWGTLNSITVEADDNADASAYLNYLSYHSDLDGLGSVKVHDMDVRALGESADAYLRTEYSDLTFDNSVVNVTAGYDAQGNYAYAAYATASLDLNWANDNGFVDGLITELNVRANGNHNCADVEFNNYAGDIDNLRVTAYGWHSSADANIQFSNDSVVNAIHDIYVEASGRSNDAHAYFHATDGLKDIQITGGDIYVGAHSEDANAGLNMNSLPVSGQVGRIVVEADNYSADAWANISGHDLSVLHERTTSDLWNDSSIRVSAVDHSYAHLAISGYGQYLDSVILSANDSSDTNFSLDMQGFIDTLDIQVLADDSYVSADITQQTYGGVVNVSGSENYYSSDALAETIHWGNVVDLAYRVETAEVINIDNTGRSYDLGGYSWTDGLHFVAGNYDDTLQLNLLLDVADQDIPYTSHGALLDYHSVTINGWTDNDSISFANGSGVEQEQGVVGVNYEENWADVSISRLFSDANTALDGTVDYYFGVSGGNGYLFHDEDGVGITTVVELMGITAFDYHQIHGNSVV